jgi:hypothetical protein
MAAVAWTMGVEVDRGANFSAHVKKVEVAARHFGIGLVEGWSEPIEAPREGGGYPVNTRDKLDDRLDTGPVELVRAALLDLATYGTPVAIARHLSGLGITGGRGLSSDCPLARYLTTRVGRETLISGHTAAVHVEGEGWVDTPLPELVAAFVAYFDGGLYPYLRPAPAAPPRWMP